MTVGVYQESVLSPFVFAVVVDVVTEFARESVISELLYADDYVLMNETIGCIGYMFMKWKEAFCHCDDKMSRGQWGCRKVQVDPTTFCCWG